MISIIVCSINEALFESFSQSVYQTIGVDYEIVKVDNDGNKYSIAAAYNTGAEKAKFDYLCFAHEDILFRTDNWGEIIIGAIEQDDNFGLIGIAGSKYKSLSPGGWPNGAEHLDCYNLIQCYGDKKSLQVSNPEGDVPLVEVKVLDGVFLFTSKLIWQNNKFDADTFKGFHGYDLDFSLQIGRQSKVLVTYQFLIEHLSPGAINKDWIIASIRLSEKWSDYLPVGDIRYGTKKGIEWEQKRLFFLKMLVYKFSVLQASKFFFSFGYLRFYNLKGNVMFAFEVAGSIFKKLYKK